MKQRGRHPEKALSATRVRALKEPGRYMDGGGLHLLVDPKGAKRWVLRTVVRGKRRDMGLGSASLVSLAEARELARTYRKIAREGGDPLAVRRQERTDVPTFAEAARRVHAEHAPAWKNPKHRDQWINTLSEYAFPHFGERRLDQIETADVLKALTPIWLHKPETARRVRQRIRTVLDWAKAAGFRSGDNPADSVSRALPRQPDKAAHHAAMPYPEVPAFVERLRSSDLGEITKLAFEFLILTACRTGEVLQARWDEIDLEAAVWTVPAERMKAAKEHRVPLPARCVEILERARALSDGDELVFPGRTRGRPLSNMTFTMALRRMETGVTAHGFRSSFRDWSAEATAFPNEVAEAALAHVVKSKVERAYRRGDLFAKRRELMEAWARFLENASAEVVELRLTALQPGD